MKMVRIIFAITFCAITFEVSAQQVYNQFSNDAVRFSQPTTVAGTARFIGIGGANTSLGGDISSISANPAGLGFYNKSAWSISPVLRIGDFNATYEGTVTGNYGLNFQLPNAGMVFHNRFEEYAGSNWISGTFGIAWNQKTSFYNVTDYEGTIGVGENGLVNDFMEFAIQPFIDDNDNLRVFNNTSDIDQFAYSNPYTELAYETFLLDQFTLPSDEVIVDRYDRDPDTGEYTTSSVRQTESIVRTGGITTLDLSYGANYNDKLYLGAGLNIHFLNFNESRTYREYHESPELNYFELTEEKEISGAGVGLTVGAIYKPIDMLNIGVSYTTPTFISMNEVQTLNLTSFFFNEDPYLAPEIINEVPEYSFMIPQKISGGATVFLNKYGFVTADVEVIDYSRARFNSNNGAFADFSEGAGPEAIESELRSAVNLRVGAEGRLGVFRVRAGYAYFDNPYNSSGVQSFDQGRYTASGGFGIFRNGFSADITYSLSSFNNPNFYPIPVSEQTVSSDSNISSFRLTLGKSF